MAPASASNINHNNLCLSVCLSLSLSLNPEITAILCIVVSTPQSKYDPVMLFEQCYFY